MGMGSQSLSLSHTNKAQDSGCVIVSKGAISIYIVEPRKHKCSTVYISPHVHTSGYTICKWWTQQCVLAVPFTRTITTKEIVEKKWLGVIFYIKHGSILLTHFKTSFSDISTSFPQLYNDTS
jgi:hypothetical protein